MMQMTEKFRAQDVVLFLYLLLLPLNHITIPGIGAAYQLVIIPVIIYFFYALFTVNQGRIRAVFAMRVWTILLVFQGMSILWSEDAQSSVSQFISLLEIYLVTILILNQTFTQKTKRLIEYAFLLNGLVYLSFMLFLAEEQSVTGRFLISFGYWGFMDPNEWCAYMIVPTVFLLQRIYDDRRLLLRVGSVVYLLVVFYCGIKTGSRGGLLALSATVLVYVFLRGKRRPLSLIGGLLFLGLLVFFVFRYVMPQMSSTLLSRYTEQGVMVGGWGAGRGEIWSQTLAYIWSNLRVLFVGNGLYGAVSVSFVSHNQWIQVLLDTGLIGLGLFVTFNVSVFRSAVRQGTVELSCYISILVSMLSLTAYGWLKIVYIVYMLCLMRYEDSTQTLAKRGNRNA